MSEARAKMVAALRTIVVPELGAAGYSGSFPHFRRLDERQVNLLTFQFNRHGGSFVIEVARSTANGFTTYWGKHIPAVKLTAHDIHPNERIRLGYPPKQPDHWFCFESEEIGSFTEVAAEVLALLTSNAERFWQTGKPPIASTSA